MKFSIVVAAYNVAEYLNECVDSIANQDFDASNFEVILIDDGSTDQKTSKICDDLSDKYSVVKVIHQENQGLSSARNTGIKNSQGEYILFVDGDDFWSNKDFLSNLSVQLKKNKSDVIIFPYSKYYGIDNYKTTTLKTNFDYNSYYENVIQLVSNEVMIAPAWNKCVKKELFDRGLSFPVGLLSEDCLYCADLLKQMNSYSILNIQCYMYRQNRDGSITNIVKEKNVIDILESIKKGMDDNTQYNNNLRQALNIYFAISYISILPYVNQYIENLKIKELLYQYKYLLKYAKYIENRAFKLTGLLANLLGIKFSIKLFPVLLKFYK
ncbi:glycosyltransferase [Streptococcus cristatus]|uniref:Glycosyl transferase n=2 Tax=Streptococcus cristatus TaxID=45634 RepID=A0A512A9U0_STRCR|nr:glycosyltransferase family 2 protein [Streptococcus cristatus]AGK70482.1 glycosyltransferase [Streptococcus cristatus AS 1.3089]GEN96470.1 glycosyl transferase [Streptococcus cristatus]SQI47916.1 glycosyltransferase [Streptococcus cristatus]